MPKAEAMASAASIPETKAINKFGHWSKESGTERDESSSNNRNSQHNNERYQAKIKTS